MWACQRGKLESAAGDDTREGDQTVTRPTHLQLDTARPAAKRNSKDCSTITDLSTGPNLPEVEIVSLVEEAIPRYKLKQDYLAEFGGPEHGDWTVKTPVLTPAEHSVGLTPEQAEATLDYFVSCGDSVSLSPHETK